MTHQHHRRNGTLRNGGVKRAVAGPTETTDLKSTSSDALSNSPPFVVAEAEPSPHKTMIAVQTSLNGNIFMHCPVDMTEDFQVIHFAQLVSLCTRAQQQQPAALD
jgi:hypothetical protein